MPGINQFGGNYGFSLFGSSYGFVNNSGVVFDPSAQDFFSYWDTDYPNSIKIPYNDLIVRLKSTTSLRGTTTNWQEMEALWILMGPDRQISYLNVRYPSLSPVQDRVQPTFIPYQFIVGNGSTQSIIMNWNAALNTTVMSQNDSSVFIWCETNSDISAIAIGASNSSNRGIFINPRTKTNIIQGTTTGANANIGTAGSTTDSSGFKMIRRINSTQIRTNKGGVPVSSEFVTSSASEPLVNASLEGLAKNSNGIINNFDSRAYSIMGAGSGYLDPVELKLALEEFKS